MKLFVKGRKQTFSILKKEINKGHDVIWVHVASLGEFEQGLPIIDELKLTYPSYKILVTFFSPSGYEVKKNTPSADAVTYLPMDTKTNVQHFLDLTQPKLAIFVKYEIWPNYLKELNKGNIPTILISAIFRKNQIYFKPYGSFMKRALGNFNYIFVQDKNSKKLLKSINIINVSVSGDTRFDRVSKIIKQDNSLNFMEQFKQNTTCFVAGSTWPEDEEIIVSYINSTENKLKYVLAPHKINKDEITSLKKSINKNTLLYSEITNQNLSDFDVLIIDTIGLLTKIYSYASMAYVGGGFATGLHNTLEPAAFGIPVIIGPKYKGFKEAEELVIEKGILTIANKVEFQNTTNLLIENPDFCSRTGEINSKYVLKNKGASTLIIEHICSLL